MVDGHRAGSSVGDPEASWGREPELSLRGCGGGGRGTEGRPAQELSLRVRRSRLISSPASQHPGSHPTTAPLSLVLAPTLPPSLGSNKGTGPPPRVPGQGGATEHWAWASSGQQRSSGIDAVPPGPDPGPSGLPRVQSTTPYSQPLRGTPGNNLQQPWGRMGQKAEAQGLILGPAGQSASKPAAFSWGCPLSPWAVLSPAS